MRTLVTVALLSLLEPPAVTGSSRAAGTLAFISARDDNDAAVFTMDGNGAHVHRVTTSPPVARQPAVSPDGRLVAFIRRVAPTREELWVARTDGTHARALLRSAAQRSAPAWTPGGARVGYTLRLDAKRVELRSVALDAHGDRLELRDAAQGAWSSAGALAFVRDGAVFVRPRPGAAARRIARGGSPAWSPD